VNITQDCSFFTSTDKCIGTTHIVDAGFNPRTIANMSMDQNRKYAMVFIPVIILIIIGFLFFFRKKQVNPVTGKTQYIDLSPQEEIAAGLLCAPDMAARFNGLYPDTESQNRIKGIGEKLVSKSQAAKSPYQFDFHVLADSQIVNAYAFPGGQIFITWGLLKILENDDEVAAVLAHEIGHIIARHAGERLSGFSLPHPLADTVRATAFDSDQAGTYISDLVDMDYNQDEELEADHFAISCITAGGYKTGALLKVLENLEKELKGKPVGLARTHPVSESRLETLKPR
jgi:predicted Zn-dependent protease